MRARPSPFSPLHALYIFTLVVLLLVGASPLLEPLGLTGLVLAQLAFIGGVPVLAARLGGVPIQDALALTRPPNRSLGGAVLVGASFWVVNLVVVVPLVQRYIGGAEELAELERRLLGDGAPLPVLLLAVALVPAVCEELLVRGVVARAFVRKLGLAGAIAASAGLFAFMHLSVPRLVPTVLLGAVLAWATLSSGSVLTSMIIHFLNNSIALALATGNLPAVAAALADHPIPLALGAAALTGAGLMMLPASGGEAPSEPQ